MSKNKNIRINDELSNAPILSELQNKNSFEVPENYFQNLENEIFAGITTETAAAPKFAISRILYYAVAASVAILITFFAIKFYSNNSESDFIANDNPIITTPENITPEQNHSPENNVENIVNNKENTSGNSENEIIVNKHDANPISDELNIEQQNIDNPKRSSLEENSPVQENKSINNSNDIAQQNAPNFIEPSSNNLGGQSIAPQQHQQVTNTASSHATARIKKHENLFLPYDTCLNHTFVYTLPKNVDWCKSLKYKWNTKTESNTLKISKSGVYFVDYYVNGKYNHTDTMKVSIIPIPKSHLVSDRQVCNHESVLLRTGLSNKLYSFKWSVSEQNQSEILASNLEPGIQDVSVEIRSCCDTIISTITLDVQDCNIKIPNVITPNGDGYNDVFVIEGLEHYPNSSLTIFNRNGKMIYQSADYKNDWKAVNIADGNYFYSLIINDKHKTEKGGILKVMRK